MAQVLDLRGRQLVRDPAPVLLDPSGSRARVLAWVGRAVAVVFLVWLIGLVFAGLGLLPSSDLPFGRAFVGQATPILKSMPPITQPEFAGPSAAAQSTAATRFGHPTSSSGAAAAGSRAGLTAGATSGDGSGARAGSGAPASSGNGHGSTGATNGSGASGGSATATSGASSNANNGLHAGGSGPGRTVSQSSPGHTKSSGTGLAAGSGSSSASSGHGHQTITTSTTFGKSGSAPGHAPFG